MIDYRSPVADILFALRHGARAQRLPHWDDELAAEVLTQAGRFVDEVIAPLDVVGDETHARLEGGRVKMPPAFVAAYRRFADGGWPGLAVPEEHGGQGLPHVLASCLSEMLSGACISYQMVLSLAQGAQRTLATNGSATQKATWLPRLAGGEWLASMCLTEPQAGSDLGLVRTVAMPQADGSWRITGSKIFISGGDQDMTGKVVHLVLARTPDAPPGVKGLALFLCPSEFDDGRRNAVQVVRLEDKMGMHASPTCQMAFDAAHAEIVGAPGEGLARMFTMMNAERLDVAVQGVGLADVAAQRARAYAMQRRQGRVPGEKETAVIVRHADVRRMLLQQLALALGSRALVLDTIVELDLGERPALLEFLTPVCKAFATDAAMTAADLAIQIHGGYGFLREYRVEQIVRDGRITRIYEGTNGIQAMTLAGRCLQLDGGAAARAFAAWAEDAAAAAPAETAAALRAALADWTRAADAVAARRDPGPVADAFMRLTGLVALGAAWARLEAAADQAPEPALYRAAATFARDWLLPETAHLAGLCVAGKAIPELPLD